MTGTVATGSGFYEFSPFGISSDAGVLPVLFGNVKASQQSAGIKIDWSNMTESNIANYTIERSTDGYNFTTIATVAPSRNDGSRADYSYLDMTATATTNYYRIKAIENGSAPKFSIIVKVSTANGGLLVSLYPNPVTGNQVSLQVTALPKGQYTIRVTGANGQQLYSKALLHNGGSVTEVLQLPSAIKPGMYNVQLIGGEINQTRTLIVR